MTKKTDSTQDNLHRFIFDNVPVRGEYIHLEESYQEILGQHDYPEPVRKLLGEALCVAGLLRAILKFDGRLTVQFQGKGKLKLLLAQCDKHFHIRGLAKWEGEISHENLMEALNDGMLVIMLDSDLNKRYQGIVSWRGDSLAKSIETYFLESEQLQTRIWLAGDEKAGAGFLLQIMPDKENEAEDNKVHPQWNRIITAVENLDVNEILNENYEEVLNKYYPQDEIRIFPADEVQFKCTCSKKRCEDAILIFGQKEAEEELQDRQSLAVICDFCNREYLFDRNEVIYLFEKNNPPTHTQH